MIEGPEVKGIIPVTMLDWEGFVAATLFVGGCNFRCPCCHNPELVLRSDTLASVPWQSIEKHLVAKRSWLDGCVVTGGEPTLHPDLDGLVSRIKSLGYPVKLDTNGSRPEELRRLVGERLVDLVALDIKTSWLKYDAATRSAGFAERVRQSAEILAASDVETEFRTTVVPGYVEREDLDEIARFLKGLQATGYVLQQFRPQDVLDRDLESVRPYDRDWLDEAAGGCSRYVPTRSRYVL